MSGSTRSPAGHLSAPERRYAVSDVEGAAHNAVTTAGAELAVAIDTFLSETSWRRQEVLGD